MTPTGTMQAGHRKIRTMVSTDAPMSARRWAKPKALLTSSRLGRLSKRFAPDKFRSLARKKRSLLHGWFRGDTLLKSQFWLLWHYANFGILLRSILPQSHQITPFCAKTGFPRIWIELSESYQDGWSCDTANRFPCFLTSVSPDQSKWPSGLHWPCIKLCPRTERVVNVPCILPDFMWHVRIVISVGCQSHDDSNGTSSKDGAEVPHQHADVLSWKQMLHGSSLH